MAFYSWAACSRAERFVISTFPAEDSSIDDNHTLTNELSPLTLFRRRIYNWNQTDAPDERHRSLWLDLLILISLFTSSPNLSHILRKKKLVFFLSKKIITQFFKHTTTSIANCVHVESKRDDVCWGNSHRRPRSAPARVHVTRNPLRARFSPREFMKWFIAQLAFQLQLP